jgi:PAS domain S-box-containing protein
VDDVEPRNEELRKREAQLAEAQRLAHLGSWDWEIETDTATWSDELYRIFGVTPMTFEPTYDAFMEKVHPADRKRVARSHKRAREASQPWTHEYRIVRPDGDVRTLETNGGIIVDERGLVSRLVGATWDITDRKLAEEALRQSEERYRSLFDRVPVGLYRSTPSGQHLDVNLAHVELLGYPDRESLLAVSAIDLYVDADDRQRWQDLMERFGTVPDFEAAVKRFDGKIIWVRDTARVVRDEQGRSLYYEGSMEDITERNRVEADLRRTLQQLSAADEERRRLLTRVVTVQEEERSRVARELHDELGQLLTSIGLFARNLETKRDAERRTLDRFQHLLDRAMQTTRNLVRSLRPPELDLHGLVPAISRLAEDLQGRHGNQIDVSSEGEIERPLPEVETAIYRIVQEALTNVIKHSNSKKTRISLARRERDLLLAVIDDGEGFDATAAMSIGLRGEHMGLLGMRERAASVGGQLRVESIPGRGTSVHLRIPSKRR